MKCVLCVCNVILKDKVAFAMSSVQVVDWESKILHNNGGWRG